MGGIAKLFGGGNTPTIEKVNPAPTTVATSSEVATGSGSNKKKRRGFSSTQTSTIASGGEGGRNTLG
jgi:hypothetical protein